MSSATLNKVLLVAGLVLAVAGSVVAQLENSGLWTQVPHVLVDLATALGVLSAAVGTLKSALSGSSTPPPPPPAVKAV